MYIYACVNVIIHIHSFIHKHIHIFIYITIWEHAQAHKLVLKIYKILKIMITKVYNIVQHNTKHFSFLKTFENVIK